jgi:hypothetical protein
MPPVRSGYGAAKGGGGSGGLLAHSLRAVVCSLACSSGWRSRPPPWWTTVDSLARSRDSYIATRFLRPASHGSLFFALRLCRWRRCASWVTCVQGRGRRRSVRSVSVFTLLRRRRRLPLWTLEQQPANYEVVTAAVDGDGAEISTRADATKQN